MLEMMDDSLNAQSPEVEVRIPYGNSELVDLFRRRGAVDAEEHTAEGTLLRGRIPRRYEWRFEPYRVSGDGGTKASCSGRARRAAQS